jgi:predicted alpha/beta hydrolase
MKMKIDLENMTKGDWLEYVEICGWTLARAHARTGDAAMIGGYLGKNDTFDSALKKFATCYADQAERDHATLVKAIRAGRLKAQDNAAA